MESYFWFLAFALGHVLFSNHHVEAIVTCTWKEVKDTSIGGGEYILVDSRSECQSACLTKSGCRSIDYDAEGLCTLHTAQDGLQPSPNSSHFDYVCHDPCKPNPCQNGGQCLQGTIENEFKCACINGWSSSLCDIPPGPCGKSPCKNGGVCSIGVSFDEFVCSCKNGFSGLTCETPPHSYFARKTRSTTPQICTIKMDVAIIVDSSSSVCGTKICQNWYSNLEFIEGLIDRLNIGSDEIRVAIFTFADTASLTFHLDEYTDKASLLAAVKTIKYTGGQTNTTGAFRFLLSDIFVPEHGDRPDVSNTVITITDGSPNIAVEDLQKAVDRVHELNINSLAIGVTGNVNDFILKLISSPPGVLNENYFKVRSFGELNIVHEKLIGEICQEQ